MSTIAERAVDAFHNAETARESQREARRLAWFKKALHKTFHYVGEIKDSTAEIDGYKFRAGNRIWFSDSGHGRSLFAPEADIDNDLVLCVWSPCLKCGQEWGEPFNDLEDFGRLIEKKMRWPGTYCNCEMPRP